MCVHVCVYMCVYSVHVSVFRSEIGPPFKCVDSVGGWNCGGGTVCGVGQCGGWDSGGWDSVWVGQWGMGQCVGGTVWGVGQCGGVVCETLKTLLDQGGWDPSCFGRIWMRERPQTAGMEEMGGGEATTAGMEEMGGGELNATSLHHPAWQRRGSRRSLLPRNTGGGSDRCRRRGSS